MRCKYREVRTVCGEYLDVDIFPVMQVKYNAKRGKRFKPTSETMARYNQRKRETRLEQLVLTNFSEDGLFFNPTWDSESLPKDEREAKRFVVNFLRRLKAYRKKNGLPDLKYIYKIERGKRSGRLHSHMILNCCDMPLGMLDEIWARGYCYSSRLQCDASGCPGLAKYFCKGKDKDPEEDEDLGNTVGYSWVASRNLEKPKRFSRDGRVSKRQAIEICTGEAPPKPTFERLYPGYELAEVRSMYNEINGGYYVTARMRRIQTRKKGQQCRKRS